LIQNEDVIMKHLILGGARSGKSRFAEQQAKQCADASGQQLMYVATATAGDEEMKSRIQQHKDHRGSQWHLVEEPLSLSSIIERHRSPNDCLLVDCLTLWLSNCLMEKVWPAQRSDFLQVLKKSQATIFMVSNEVGSGIVPLGELSRTFVDESGWLHQELATLSDEVSLIVAGLPLTLKAFEKR
jgi:adenosylcobinamide kinase/adenosylcobinamide-phosphate guanylyltransferase